MQIITVSDLMKELSKCGQDLPVNIYCEEDTYWIRDVDASMADRIDINCKEL